MRRGERVSCGSVRKAMLRKGGWRVKDRGGSSVSVAKHFLKLFNKQQQEEERTSQQQDNNNNNNNNNNQ